MALAAEVTAEVTFLGAHVVPAGRGPRRRLPGAGHRPDARRLRPARALGRRVLRAASRTPSTATRPARCCSRPRRRAGAARPRQPARPGPGVALAVELGAASVDHCTLPDRRRRRRLAGSGDTVATLLPGRRVLHPVALSRRAAAARRGRPARARERLQPRHVRVVVDAADDRAGRAGDGHDARRGPARRDRGGARALRRDDVGVLAPAGAPTSTVLDAPSHLHLAYRPGVPLARALELG